MSNIVSSMFFCCSGKDTQEDEEGSAPTERTGLLAPSMDPPIAAQPEQEPEPQSTIDPSEDEEAYDAIYGNMIESMVRVKQSNPFLTAGVDRTPSISRNPSPQSRRSSSRGDRSISRGRVSSALQVRRVRPVGLTRPRGPPVQEAEEQEQRDETQPEADPPAETRPGADDRTSAYPERKDDPENQNYTVNLSGESVVKPWRKKFDMGD